MKEAQNQLNQFKIKMEDVLKFGEISRKMDKKFNEKKFIDNYMSSLQGVDNIIETSKWDNDILIYSWKQKAKIILTPSTPLPPSKNIHSPNRRGFLPMFPRTPLSIPEPISHIFPIPILTEDLPSWDMARGALYTTKQKSIIPMLILFPPFSKAKRGILLKQVDMYFEVR